MACTTMTEMHGEMFDGKMLCIMYRSSRNVHAHVVRMSVSAVGTMLTMFNVIVTDHIVLVWAR